MKAKLNKKSVSLNLNLQEFSLLTEILGQWLEAYHEEDCEWTEFVEKHQGQFEKVDKYINKCIESNNSIYPQKINFVAKGHPNASRLNAIITGYSKQGK